MIEEPEGLDEFMREIWLDSTPMYWVAKDKKGFVYCSAREWMDGVHEFGL